MQPLSNDLDFLMHTCFSKKQLSFQLAQKLAKQYNQRPYCCFICNSWHLTKYSESQFLDSYNNRIIKNNTTTKQAIINPNNQDITSYRKQLRFILWSALSDSKLIDIAKILNMPNTYSYPLTKKTKSTILEFICCKTKWLNLTLETLNKIEKIINE